MVVKKEPSVRFRAPCVVCRHHNPLLHFIYRCAENPAAHHAGGTDQNQGREAGLIFRTAGNSYRPGLKKEGSHVHSE